MAGIYIHVPFCRKKCSYCDFHFSTSFQKYRSAMIDSLVKEIDLRVSYLKGKPLKSIYFGGGTPSVLNEFELTQILESIKKSFNVSTVEEITLEANPEDISEALLHHWMNLGINRLSIGVQSFKATDLEWMNRNHSLQQTYVALDLIRTHFKGEVSIDLMYGLPDLAITEWKDAIQKVLSYNFNHISAYCLTVEKKTNLYQKVKNRTINPSDESMQIEQFEVLLHTLKENGFEQYEISNFAKNKKYALHNSSYWLGATYLGIGPSAHSFNGSTRSWNIANNALYMKGISELKPCMEEEQLSPNNRFNELLLTGLRTKWGVDMNILHQLVPLDPSFKKQLEEFIQNGEINIEDGQLKLTEKGKLKADYICSSLFVVD